MDQPLLICQRYETAFHQTQSGYKPVSIEQEDRRYHFYIIGKTGMGKSTLLKLMVIQDIIYKRGVAVLDPHGDLAEELLDFVPPYRVNDLVYFNPQDISYPFSLNPFEKVDKEKRGLLASGILSVFYKLFKESWGPRLEHILRHSILLLLEIPNSSLLSIPRLLQDRRWRQKILSKVKDPEVRAFFTFEYPSYGKFEAEAISPILNKVGAFVSNPLIRNITCQRKGLNFSDLMDRRKILIANLAKGVLGEDNQIFLGSLLVTKLQLAAMERVKIEEEDREDFFLYVDEFQNFATDSFASILSEARKYRLNLTLAHQYLDQLEDSLKRSIFGNVGTIIAFNIGVRDAERIEREICKDRLMRDYLIGELISLDRYEIYLRLIVDGEPIKALKAETYEPLEKPEQNHRDKAIRLSRQRYCQSRQRVEKQITRWYEDQERSMRG